MFELKVLITMLYECAINEAVIYKQTPNKVYLITINARDQVAAAKRLKEKFPNITFETIFVNEFDVVGITAELNKIIKKEKGNIVFINITEGRKTMSIAGLIAASMNKSLVEGAFYLRQDTHELMPAPLFDFSISDNKRRILEELNKGNKKVSEITKKLKVNRSLVYAAILDLIKRKYLAEDWTLTDSGKICLMANREG